MERIGSRIRSFWTWMQRPSAPSWFLFAGLIFGLAFAVITPPFMVPDEYNHFYRAYQIADGNPVPTKHHVGTGGWLPANLFTFYEQSRQDFQFSDLDELASIPLKPSDKIFMRFENTALYSPVPYIPQATGIFIGKTAQAPPMALMYLARIFNVIAYVLLIYLAIRLLPFGKWAAAVIALLPMHVMLAGSMSADAITIGLIALTVATVLHLRTMERMLTRREFLLILALVTAVCLLKPPLPLILLLFALVPYRVFATTKRGWLIRLGGLAASAIIVGGAWLAIATLTTSPYGPENANPAAQQMFIKEEPMEFIKVLWRTYFTDASDYFSQNYVASVGYLYEWLPLWMTYLYGIFLAFALFPIRAAKGTLRHWERLLPAGILALCFVLIAALVYVSWTAPAGRMVDGLQARYFTPLLFLLIPLLAMRSRKDNQQEGNMPTCMYKYGVIFFLACALAELFSWFYRVP